MMKKNIPALLLVCVLFTSCTLLETLPTPSLSSQTETSTLTEIIITATASLPTQVPSLTPTIMLSATPTQFPLALQAGTPLYSTNFGYPDEGCKWLGVGGQIFAKDGKPINNLVVWIRGTIKDIPLEIIALTGTAAGDKYGPGGYEAILAKEAMETSGNFSIQVLDLDGNVLTEQIFFDTHAACDKNLVLINFVEK